METCCSPLDFLHHPSSLPSVKRDSYSKFGIILTIIFLLLYAVFEVFKIINYSSDYTVSYSQDFQKTNTKINKNVTFGFKLGEGNLNEYFKLEFYDSSNNIIENNISKICDSNLNEIKGNKTSKNNYICFIDYPIIGSNRTNHILKARIIYEGEKQQIKERIPLFVKFIEPTIKHDNSEPFDYSELYEMVYFYDMDSVISYRKYIKIIDYKTKGFVSDYEDNSAYLDDNEDLSKTNATIDETVLGSFRFILSKKKDIFERKYVGIIEYFLSVVISNFISMKGFFELLTMILVNPLDNLRIFISLNKKKPTLFNDTSDLINDYWQKKENNIDDIKNDIKKDYSCGEKFKLFWKCCRKKEKKYLIAIDDFVGDKLIISGTLERTIINDIKYSKMKEKIKSKIIPQEYKDREYEYLVTELHDEFPDYEEEEIKVKIKEILEEQKKEKKNNG